MIPSGKMTTESFYFRMQIPDIVQVRIIGLIFTHPEFKCRHMPTSVAPVCLKRLSRIVSPDLQIDRPPEAMASDAARCAADSQRNLHQSSGLLKANNPSRFRVK
ncbi:hypothetical protein [Burkholderia sp. Bp9090]|uniref:hypothetical protein n=1 Tax=Burkholderia sp. Bp9090 TaxID=2184567 RepID=UPI000F5DB615|nr:hypothetical protein [Burkholderia sp. Bp9090]